MDSDRNQRRFDSVYSEVIRAGKRRTYFFDVRQTKGNDYYLTITESKKRFDSNSYERHKIFLYKEDFNRFLEGLNATIDHVKSELLPEYDYDEYTRRHEEYEAQREEEEGQDFNADNSNGSTDKEEKFSLKDIEEDLSW